MKIIGIAVAILICTCTLAAADFYGMGAAGQNAYDRAREAYEQAQQQRYQQYQRPRHQQPQSEPHGFGGYERVPDIQLRGHETLDSHQNSDKKDGEKPKLVY